MGETTDKLRFSMAASNSNQTSNAEKKTIRKKVVRCHRRIRLIFAHTLCAIHMGLSIWVLYVIKAKTQLYFIPMVGTILFGVEAIVSLIAYRCKEFFRGFSILVFVYSTTIIACIWVLELHRISELKKDAWKPMPISFNNFQQFSHSNRPWTKPKELVKNFKNLWLEIEIQVYLFLLLTLRALLPKQDSISYFGKSELLFKYFATGMDLLDFIELLTYPQLYNDSRLVYATLSVWSISCLQFVIYFPEVKDNKLKELTSVLTNSLLTAFLMDVPFLVVRLYAIFGSGKHDYTSYFFVFKNLVVILLQIARIQAICMEGSRYRNEKRQTLTLVRQPSTSKTTRIPIRQPGKSGAKIIFSNFDNNRRAMNDYSDV